ncbi:MFS transporter protein [Rutstroemia sp. NJR-2017a BBW]|nr:MFS transporter protein [Rutstroemia sp. NJR-2017a BBW]
MKDSCEISLPIGHGWRSSRWFVLMTIAIALFAETFLYGFLVPILGHMLQNRLHVEPLQVQTLSSAVLALHGAVAVVFSPIIGHLADKSSSRKKSLLLSLGFCIVGTLMVAGATSVPVLIIGRVIQGIAGSAVWIIGFATVTDILSRDAIGFGISLMISFANAGTVTGPVVSGLLIETAGYWVTWSIPLIVLAIDLLARLIMIESPYNILPSSDEDADTGSSDPLCDNSEAPPSAGSFWRIMMCDGRVVACLLIVFTSVSVTTSFEATLPFQVQQKFGWDLRAVGLLFAGLVIPGVLIGPLAGWIRDRVGARPPVVVCSVIQAVILGLLGVAGRDIPSGDIPKTDGRLYVASILAIGALRPFVSGIAPAELADAAKERQEKAPGVFGPQGSVSRVFAMTDVAVALGMMIGPVMGSSLKAMVGYELMNCAWGPRISHESPAHSEEAV